MLELDRVPHRFKKLGEDEPLEILLSRVRVGGYIASVLSGLFEKRDNTERWEKQLVILEETIADLYAQLEEARAGQRLQ